MVERIEINLIPQEYRVRTKKFQIKKDILVPIIVSTVLISASLIWNAVLEGQIKSVKTQISKIEREIRKYDAVKREITRLGKEQKAMENKIAGLEQINVVRDKWVRLLELYAKTIPSNTWLTNITEAGSSVSIFGESNAFGEVGEFMVKLSEDSLVNGVNLLEVRGKGAKAKSYTFKITQELSPALLVKTTTQSNSN